MGRKGRTNKELLTWKKDLLSPWFWAEWRNWGRMQTFSEQPSGQIFPKKTASRMPVPYLGLKHARLKILRSLRSVHTYVRGSRTPFLEEC